MKATPQAAPKTSRSDWQKISESVARNFSTEEFAAALKVKPQSIRAAYCRDGHYLNVIPVKLVNGRLLWPADGVDALVAGRPVVQPNAALLETHAQRKAVGASKIPAHIARKVEAKAKRLAAGEG